MRIVIYSTNFIFDHKIILNIFSRSRGVASSVAVALNYIVGFIARKMYYSLETTLTLPGTKLFFCIVCGLGFVWMSLILPETESKSLEDIERHFSDNSKKITDRKILTSNEKVQSKNVDGFK